MIEFREGCGKITKGDVNLLKYNWQCKGDIAGSTRHTGIKGDLKKHYPEVMKAWKKYKKAEATLNSLLGN